MSCQRSFRQGKVDETSFYFSMCAYGPPHDFRQRPQNSLWQFRRRRSFDFEVGKGSVYGLIGPNGAGKTTTIKAWPPCWNQPTAKSNSGRSVLNEPEEARKILGYMPDFLPFTMIFGSMNSATFLPTPMGWTQTKEKAKSRNASA